MEAYAGQQYVGIDLHRRRTVIVRTSAEGELLEAVRIANDADTLAEVLCRAGESPEVVLEATYGWYWAVDTLQAVGASVHLAHPLGVKGFEYRRVKNDLRDAADLADLLRMGRLPEAWIAPPATRELRELVRHRAKLVALRSHCKAGVHAVLAKCGIPVPMTDLFGVGGTALLDRLDLPKPYPARITSLRRVMDTLDFEIDVFTRLARNRLAKDPGYIAVQTIPGIGPIFAAILVVEIGDVHRFATAPKLTCWAGLTPRPPRVRHHRAPRPDHQARQRPGPLGHGRVRPTPASPHRPGHVPREDRRQAWAQHRGRGRRPPTAGIRLLRATRPPRPRPQPATGDTPSRMSTPDLVSAMSARCRAGS
jgi:transposase